VLTAFVMLAYAGVRLVSAGHKEKFVRGSSVFEYYCGPAVGKFFDWFTTFSIYMSFVVILAGAGASLEQQFGLPSAVGVILIAVLALITVIGGFNRVVNVLGNIGPVIIVLVFVVGFAALVRGTGSFREIDAAIQKMELLRAADHWLLSAVSYIGISMIWLTTFLTHLGAEAESKKKATRGIFMGTAVFFFGVLLVTAAMMRNIDALAGSQVPMLLLAKQLHPIAASIFTVIVFLGIYTTSVPLLWTVTSRVIDEKSKYSRLAVLAATAIGAVIALTLSFDKLVNIVYVICGYFGSFLCVAVIWKDIYGLLKKKRG